MRILGNLDRLGMKITVFSNENRISLKFEREGMEQTYKFRDDEHLRSFEQAGQLADDGFCKAVLEQFGQMARTRYFAWQRYLPEQEDEFEEII